MLFKQSFHKGLATGSITLTFRRWSRPQVRPGGRYRLDARGVLEVDAIDRVRPAGITDAAAVRAGFPDRESLLAALAGRAPLQRGEAVYRVTFHYVRLADARVKLAADARLSAAEAAALAKRLQRMDAASRHGPWTRDVLLLIEAHPRTAASRLASRLSRDRLAFKADVRKLKALGLTRSLDVGYELSPRGRALLRRLKAADG